MSITGCQDCHGAALDGAGGVARIQRRLAANDATLPAVQLAGQFGAQFDHALAKRLGCAGFLVAHGLVGGMRRVELPAQLRIVGAQRLHRVQIGTCAGADLMLDHMDVAVDFLFQPGVARRMGPT